MIVTSVCSNKLCTQRTVLYGSTTAGATPDGIVDHETLQACAVISELADPVQNEIH